MNDQCNYVTQDIIKTAFKNVIQRASTKLLSKTDLTEKIANELRLTKGQLKTTYLTAFLVCYMKDLGWKYNQETETFHKIYLSHMCFELLKGMCAAGYEMNQVDKIKEIMIFKFDGHLTSCNVDTKEVSLTNQKINLRKIFFKEDL